MRLAERSLRLGQPGALVRGGQQPVVADALEAGYVWDEHLVSVANKPVRKPKKDGWYEHGQNCAEYLELNFGSIVKNPEPVLALPQYRPPSRWG